MLARNVHNLFCVCKHTHTHTHSHTLTHTHTHTHVTNGARYGFGKEINDNAVNIDNWIDTDTKCVPPIEDDM
jgi:hypothetical protein